jgi:hypothetical protein
LQQLDVVLYERFKNERHDGAPNSGPILTEKPKELDTKMTLKEENSDPGKLLITEVPDISDVTVIFKLYTCSPSG